MKTSPAYQRIRINHYLSKTGVCSRRQADRYIANQQVTINFRPAVVGEPVDPAIDKVRLNGELVDLPARLEYLALNKPAGYVVTRRDEHRRPTIYHLLPPPYTNLHPVGRLDIFSTGLLILTNDGDFTYHLTHPRHHLPKTYRVKIDKPLSSKDLNRFRNGILLNDGLTAPSEIKLIHSYPGHWYQITLTQGKNRQIRRMMATLDYHILELIRVQIGQFSIKRLGRSPYRLLTSADLQLLSPQYFNDSLAT